MDHFRRLAEIAALIGTAAMLIAGCAASTGSGGAGGSVGNERPAGEASGKPASWATASSAAAGGGMRALVAAARKEGHLNVIALPSEWANYGTIMRDFTARYGIRISDANPGGTSQDEISAMIKYRRQAGAPDVLDLGTAFAIKSDHMGLLAPYRVAEWKAIPAAEKARDSTWYGDYGGYIAIGYDSARVHVAPSSIRDLLKPVYKNQVAISGDPRTASAAFCAVYAAALASGGSLENIEPGIAFFARLKKAGNLVPVMASAATVESGQTPVVLWWDYLMASEISPAVPGFKIVIPSDATFASYADQAISKDAPDPAAARLWEEYLYSAAGQNLWLQARARPVELPAMIASRTADKTASAALPPAPLAPVQFPTAAELLAAQALVTRQWASRVG